MSGFARRAVATETDPRRAAASLADQLASPELSLVIAFADWRLDPAEFAATIQRGVRAPVVGCTTTRVLAADGTTAIAVGFYDDMRVGFGIASELSRNTLVRSRDAVHQAAAMLKRAPDALDPTRHVLVTLSDGRCPQVESFCIGSAAAVPHLRVVGGCAATDPATDGGAHVYLRGEALPEAGLAIVLELDRPFEVVRSAHVVPTDVKTVVTSVSGLVVHELDGRPAADRLAELVSLAQLDPTNLISHTFARYIDGIPYVRSMQRLDGKHVHFAAPVEAGHVMHLMRPGDLIGTTRRDLEAVNERVGGMAAFVAFSCIGRHWEAATRNLQTELAGAYGDYPTVGFESFGEQIGMLLVNHTLTGLAIGG